MKGKWARSGIKYSTSSANNSITSKGSLWNRCSLSKLDDNGTGDEENKPKSTEIGWKLVEISQESAVNKGERISHLNVDISRDYDYELRWLLAGTFVVHTAL